MSKYLCVLDCYSNNYKLNADIPIRCHTVLQIKFNAKYAVVTPVMSLNFDCVSTGWSEEKTIVQELT